MKRITRKDKNGKVLFGNYTDIFDTADIYEPINMLSEYEDTGLTPSDIAGLNAENARLKDTSKALESDNYNLNMNLEHLTAELEELREAQRWINVEEALPTQNEIVLFVEKYSRNVNYGFWEEIDRDKPFVRMFEDGRKIYFDKPDGGVWWRYRFGDALQRSSVIHWRKLPDPPQKGE